MKRLICASQLTKSYKARCVVDHIDLDIKEREIVALVGTNGAGKTTTIGMLLGIIPKDSGTIKYWTSDFKKEIGTQLQTTPFFEGYSVEDNVKLFAAFYGISLTKNEIEEKLAAFDLLQVKKTPAIKLSLGQQKRLAIIVTTLHAPKLVILDEPSAGLDPRGQREIQQIIKRLKDSGAAVLFSSHDMLEVMNVADRVLMMHHGKIIANGSPDSLMEYYQTQNLEELFFELTK